MCIHLIHKLHHLIHSYRVTRTHRHTVQTGIHKSVPDQCTGSCTCPILWANKEQVWKITLSIIHCRITVKTVLMITTNIKYNSFVFYIEVCIPSHVLLLIVNFSSRGALHIAAFAWHLLRYKTPLLPHTGSSTFSHSPSSIQTHSPSLHTSPIPPHLIPKQAIRWEEFRISLIAIYKVRF